MILGLDTPCSARSVASSADEASLRDPAPAEHSAAGVAGLSSERLRRYAIVGVKRNDGVFKPQNNNVLDPPDDHRRRQLEVEAERAIGGECPRQDPDSFDKMAGCPSGQRHMTMLQYFGRRATTRAARASMKDGLWRPPANHFPMQSKLALGGVEHTDPITHRYPKQADLRLDSRRHKKEIPQCRASDQFWSLAHSTGFHGEPGTWHDQPRDAALNKQRNMPQISASSEVIYHVAGAEDMREPGSHRYFKTDLPPTAFHVRMNNFRHLARFEREWGLQPQPQECLNSDEVKRCLQPELFTHPRESPQRSARSFSSGSGSEEPTHNHHLIHAMQRSQSADCMLNRHREREKYHSLGEPLFRPFFWRKHWDKFGNLKPTEPSKQEQLQDGDRRPHAQQDTNAFSSERDDNHRPLRRLGSESSLQSTGSRDNLSLPSASDERLLRFGVEERMSPTPNKASRSVPESPSASVSAPLGNTLPVDMSLCSWRPQLRRVPQAYAIETITPSDGCFPENAMTSSVQVVGGATGPHASGANVTGALGTRTPPGMLAGTTGPSSSSNLAKVRGAPGSLCGVSMASRSSHSSTCSENPRSLLGAASKPDGPPKRELTPPRRDVTPPRRDVTPTGARRDLTPPRGDVKQPRRDITPPGSSVGSQRRDLTPPRTDVQPPRRDVTPTAARRDVTLPKKDNGVHRRDLTPPRRDLTPPPPGRGRDSTPRLDQEPSRRDLTPPRRDLTPPRRDLTPTRRDHTPSRLRWR